MSVKFMQTETFMSEQRLEFSEATLQKHVHLNKKLDPEPTPDI